MVNLPRISNSRHQELADFQTKIANNWLKRGLATSGAYSKFLFYFIGFNALFFLWGEITGMPTGDRNRMRTLVASIEVKEALSILSQCRKSVEFFSGRTISNMVERQHASTLGSTTEGEKWRRILASGSESPDTKLQAFAEILYQVRNNLAHGSKGELGDDEEIVRHATEPTEALLRLAIENTSARI